LIEESLITEDHFLYAGLVLDYAPLGDRVAPRKEACDEWANDVPLCFHNTKAKDAEKEIVHISNIIIIIIFAYIN
jgi:hypothetical protein